MAIDTPCGGGKAISDNPIKHDGPVKPSLLFDSDLLKQTIRVPKRHALDFEKANSLEDIKTILGAVGWVVHDNHPCFEKLKPFLKEQPAS